MLVEKAESLEELVEVDEKRRIADLLERERSLRDDLFYTFCGFSPLHQRPRTSASFRMAVVEDGRTDGEERYGNRTFLLRLTKE